MTCFTCRHEFCWICFEPYTANHFENNPQCSNDHAYNNDELI